MNRALMHEAIEMAIENVREGQGGPFAAFVVRGDEILGRGTNQVTTANDPTAHAEVMAIRDACSSLGAFQLDGCDLYTTCEPCPMCLGAAYWARVDKIFFAGTRDAAARAGFIDAHIYDELPLDPADRSIPMLPLLSEEGERPFDIWRKYEKRVAY